MQLNVMPVTPYEQNCSLLICEQSGRAALIDPGGEPDRLQGELSKIDAEVEKILVTHGHFDHAGAVAEMADRLQVPIEGPHRDDAFLIDALPEWCQQVGFPPCRRFQTGRWLQQDDEVTVGEQTLEVHHCPGHTPGHVIFFHRDTQLAIVGDVLFKGSIGRTDFPRGDHATLLRSIRERLFPLGDDVRFLPGHGPMSTFGDERRDNPFVSDKRWG